MRVILLTALLPLAACGFSDAKLRAPVQTDAGHIETIDMIPDYKVGVYR